MLGNFFLVVSDRHPQNMSCRSAEGVSEADASPAIALNGHVVFSESIKTNKAMLC